MRRPSLQLRLFIAITLGIAIVTGLFSLMSADILGQSTSRTLEERTLLSQTAARHLDDAINLSLMQLGQGPADALLTDTGEASEASKRLAAYLYATLPIKPAIVSLVSTEGTVLWTEPYSPGLVGRDVSQLPSLAKWVQSPGPVVTDVTRDISQPNSSVVYLGASLKDEAGRAVALTLATIDLADTNVAVFVEPIRLGATGYAQIVDSQGVVLAATAPAAPLFVKGAHSDRFAQLITQGKTTKGTCHDCHESAAGEPQSRTDELLAFSPLPSVKWGIMIAQSEQEAMAPLRKLQFRTMLVAALVIAIAVPASWIGVRSTLRPLNQVRAASQRIAQGDLDTSVPVAGTDEVRELSRSLDEMRQALQQSRQRLQDRITQRTHELTALVRASQALTSSSGLPELLNGVVATAVDTFEMADSGVLFLHDPDAGCLVPKAAVGYDWQVLSGVQLAPTEGLSGTVLKTGKSFILDTDLEVATMFRTISDANRSALLQARGGKQPLSMVGVPLELKGRTMGSLILSSFTERSAFAPDEVQFISSFAALAATIIEHNRLMGEAAQAERLREMDKAKTEFLSNISHELRTPLTSIMISAESLLAADAPAPEDGARAKLLQNIRRNAERLNKLVGELLDITRLQTGTLKLSIEPTLIRDVIKESVETVRPLAEAKQLTLTARAPSEVALVLGDRTRLVQVMINLLTNAINFTPRNGAVTVSASPNGSFMEVTVTDTGVGIPEEEQPRIFERFYRSSRARTKGGMGLGLSITRALLKLHDGSIAVKSKPGQGSSFSFTVPLAGEDRNEGTDNRR